MTIVIRSDEADEAAADGDADPERERQAASEPNLERRSGRPVPPADAPACQPFERQHVESSEQDQNDLDVEERDFDVPNWLTHEEQNTE